MVSQLFLCYSQNNKKGTSTLLTEMFFVVTCLAPGIHAYRVSVGQEKLGHETFDNRIMLMMCKSSELVFEAIPGLLLQLFAYLTLPESSSFAIVSIFTSATMASFNTALLFFDKDTDLSTRLDNPSFWGLFPDDASSRSTAFFWLCIFHFAHVCSRSLSFALLWATFGGDVVFAFYGVELGVYLLVKVLRQDMFYWAPVPTLAMNMLAALIDRVTNKVLVDFTAYMVFRHPHESGGLYTLMVVWSQIFDFACVVLYLQYYDDTIIAKEHVYERRDKISAIALYSIAGSLGSLWLVSFATFINTINKRYIHTFFMWKTGSEYTIHLFRTSTSDFARMSSVFIVNVLYWSSIRDEVKAFTLANWHRWQAEKPEWFTDQFISIVPEEFIPPGDQGRRRNTALNFLAEGGLLAG